MLPRAWSRGPYRVKPLLNFPKRLYRRWMYPVPRFLLPGTAWGVPMSAMAIFRQPSCRSGCRKFIPVLVDFLLLDG
jgi:hypothetical protein